MADYKIYTADDARKTVKEYTEKKAAQQFAHATTTELFKSTMRRIEEAAANGFNVVSVYPIDPIEYDEYYDANPSTLGTTLDTRFTQEQLDVLHAFEQVGYRVVHTSHAGYKPKNMPAINNGGWVYDVDIMTIGW